MDEIKIMLNINEKCIDIICPLYNKEKFINDFLESLLVLPSNKVNILLVDDGSIDDTKKIIEAFISINQTNNIFYIYKKNGGVSSARNFGIIHAVSKYIWFCDPDDLVLSDSLGLFSNIDSYSSDVLVYGYQTVFEGTDKKDTKSYSDKKYTSINFLREYDYFKKNNSISTVWNKIYKRSFVRSINALFPEDMSHSEDRYFNLLILNGGASVSTIDLMIYEHKRYLKNTLSTTKNASRINDIVKADLFNILVLSNFKKTQKEKKIHIYRVTREKMFLSESNIKSFYFKECDKLNVHPFYFVSIKDFILMIYLVFK